MARTRIQYPPETVATALRIFLESNGNGDLAAKTTGVHRQTIKNWADKGGWVAILDSQRHEVEAQVAAEALRQVVTIRELRVNIHYRALAFIHQQLQEWEACPGERGAFPFDPLKLADAMAKADQGSGSSQAAAVEVEDPMAAHVPA